MRRSTVLLLLGVLLLLLAGVWHLHQRLDAAREAAALRQRLLTYTVPPPPTPTSTPTPTPSPRPTHPARPTPTMPLPTATPTPTSTPTPRPAPPVRLIIPALGIDVPVVPVTSRLLEKQGTLIRVWGTADYAAGYHENGVLPGEPGNLVISGHNNIKGQVFRPLSLLGNKGVPFPRGARIYLVDARGRVYIYAMERMLKVDVRDAASRDAGRRWLWSTRDPVLTLVTCWPPNNNTHRILVRARYVGMGDPNTLPEVCPVR